VPGAGLQSCAAVVFNPQRAGIRKQLLAKICEGSEGRMVNHAPTFATFARHMMLGSCVPKFTICDHHPGDALDIQRQTL
jgi:tRNA/tmRNA/rRNA uracil-C5-methylase (TrmA/RlmC/RlmD family)